MPTDTRKIKQQLTARNNFTTEQANDLVDALFEGADPVVTRSVLREELNRAINRATIRIVGLNLAGTGVLLALFAFAS